MMITSAATLTAAAPSPAWPTSLKSPVPCSASRRPSRMISWESTSITLVCVTGANLRASLTSVIRDRASYSGAVSGVAWRNFETPAQSLGCPAHVREAVTALLVIIGKSDTDRRLSLSENSKSMATLFASAWPYALVSALCAIENSRLLASIDSGGSAPV